MSKHLALATLVIAAFALAPTAQAASLYWDTNDTTAGFGSGGGTWGTDSYWTTDATGAFSDTPGTSLTTAADSVTVNKGNLNPFTMSVSGDVHASNIVGIMNVTNNINGPGTVHLHASGADTLFTLANNDYIIYMNAGLVVEAAGGSTVYLVKAGGNNGGGNFSGPITSTNTVDLRVNLIKNMTISGSLNHFGTFTNDSAYNFKNRGMTVSGVIGSNVTDVILQGGNPMHFTNSANAYSGNTIVKSSSLRTTTATTLPDTTEVRMFTGGTLNLNFTGTDMVAGLYFDDVAQAGGTWGTVGNGVSDYESVFFTGTGMLLVEASGPVTVDGDTNDDGVVDATDYIALKRNFGTSSGATLAMGDVADGSPNTSGQDGAVDWNDLQLMANAMNDVGNIGAVPEPATLGLLAFGVLAVIRRRHQG